MNRNIFAIKTRYNDTPFAFGIDSNTGDYGYIKAGADTVTPFSNGIDLTNGRQIGYRVNQQNETYTVTVSLEFKLIEIFTTDIRNGSGNYRVTRNGTTTKIASTILPPRTGTESTGVPGVRVFFLDEIGGSILPGDKILMTATGGGTTTYVVIGYP